MKFFYSDKTNRFQLEAENAGDCFKLGALTCVLGKESTSVTKQADKLVLSGEINDLIEAAVNAPERK